MQFEFSWCQIMSKVTKSLLDCQVAEGRCQNYCYPVFYLQSLIRSTIHFGGDGMHAQLCPTLCDPLDCSPAGSSVHGIFQARILEWVATSYSRGYSQPEDWTWFFMALPQEAQYSLHGMPKKQPKQNTVSHSFQEGVQTRFFKIAISLTITREHFRSKVPERQNKWFDYFLNEIYNLIRNLAWKQWNITIW